LVIRKLKRLLVVYASPRQDIPALHISIAARQSAVASTLGVKRSKAGARELRWLRGEPPRLLDVEPLRPRIAAVRIVDMSTSNARAEFTGAFSL
jgi:hypothetical protein